MFAGKSHGSTDECLDPRAAAECPQISMNKATAKHQLGSTTFAHKTMVKFNRIIAQGIALCRQ
jgi:hypothetical protein